MNALKSVSMLLVVASFGCKEQELQMADREQVAREAAASALTNAASFTGGQRVEGLMPEPTLSDVMLVSDGMSSVAPGDTALMSFTGDNPSQATDPVSAVLIQFDGADAHFDVTVNHATADGNALPIDVTMMLDAKVCAALCNRVFEVDVTHALETLSGGIGAHGQLTLTLDCRQTGKPSLCSSESTSDGGSPNPLLRAFRLNDDLLDEACNSCGGQDCLVSANTQAYRDCMENIFEANREILRSQAECLNAYYEEQLTCVTNVECSAAKQCAYFEDLTVGTPGFEECLVVPAALQSSFEACVALN